MRTIARLCVPSQGSRATKSLRPRPGNKGYYRDGEFVAYFEDMEWSEWSPSFNPVLDTFEDGP
jgi:hypothetical protein